VLQVVWTGLSVLGAVAIATVASRSIFGLRQQVRRASQLGQYTLIEKIGEGGMGAVYRASHAMLRRPTAVKLLPPGEAGAERLQRFEREVQMTSRLTHPNTVAIFDYGRTPDGVFYYAMEYLGDGINLAHLIARGAQPAGRVIHILEQVCGALAEAHARNLIHRDIKPANIILCERGLVPDVAKVVDFGLVKEIAAEATVVGTPHYLSPEQVLGRPITPAVDLYALGLVGYELLVGGKPFEGKTIMEYATKHVAAVPRPLPETVPPALATIIMTCLEKEPEQRFASATALANALRAVPPPGDWSEDDARAWWADFKAKARTMHDATQQPTVPITVDLGGRT
jgi:serine/threonine-protein kinase